MASKSEEIQSQYMKYLKKIYDSLKFINKSIDLNLWTVKNL